MEEEVVGRGASLRLSYVVARRQTGGAACRGRGTRYRRSRRLVEGRRSAGVGVSLIQMVKNFANDSVLSNEGNDAQGTPTITYQRIDLIDAFDELGPTFSKGGTFFW